MGLFGCPPRYYDRDRHDRDRGHDYQHSDRDNDDHELRRYAVTNEKNKMDGIAGMPVF
jgi:hypothetical protein